MTDLKPCPACGSDDLWEGGESSSFAPEWNWVECCDCGMRGPEKYQNDPITHRQAWNDLPRGWKPIDQMPKDVREGLRTIKKDIDGIIDWSGGSDFDRIEETASKLLTKYGGENE